MSNLASKAGHITRCCARQRLVASRVAPAATALAQKRFESSDASNWGATTRIPDFGKYRSKGSEEGNRTFQYVMVGTMGALTAMGAKATVVGELDAPRVLCCGGAYRRQTFSRTWRLRRTCWPWRRSRSTSLPSRRERT
jgi:hypothetical protein